MKQISRGYIVTAIILVVSLVVGQLVSYLLAPDSWKAFLQRLPVILSMVAFWGPILGILTGLFVWAMLRLLGFSSLEEIRQETVEQNNPAPAIIFTGTLIASILFFILTIRP